MRGTNRQKLVEIVASGVDEKEVVDGRLLVVDLHVAAGSRAQACAHSKLAVGPIMKKMFSGFLNKENLHKTR